MTSVIISGNFDISVGAIAAISGAVVMKLLGNSVPLPAVLLAGLALGLVIGICNGVVVAKFGVPSLIATMVPAPIIPTFILIPPDYIKIACKGYLLTNGSALRFSQKAAIAFF